jgi:formylglycine-generating enzyme required for sulfatase activity
MRKAIFVSAALASALLAAGCGSGDGSGDSGPWVPEGFALVEGGTFTMGSPDTEEDRDSDETQHQVTVRSFFMGKYEVTQKEWQEVMHTTVAQQQTAAGSSGSWGEGNNHPMYYVSWVEAVRYCNERSRKEGLIPAYTITVEEGSEEVTCNWNATGYRLPTEAEWEYAAKGGNKSLGYVYAGGNEPGAVAWYTENSEDMTHPAGTKAANELGLYDMSGNVLEWCWDWYGAYAAGAQTDPRGPESSFDFARVFRSGSWPDDAQLLRSSRRSGSDPAYRNGVLGFRLVRSQ